MSGEWRNLTLGELTTWASGGTPSKSKQEYWNGDIPWISASSMKTRFLCDSHLKITRAGLDNGSRTADTNEILLLVRGSELHKRIPVGIAVRPVAFNQDVKAIKVGDEILPVFLYYWLLANEGLLLAKVEQTGIGAGKLDTGVLKKLIVPVPPLHEQRRIAKILGDLDDKIELNRKMNETLEQMARALFKSWFIDFDPVRAKMEGRQPPGMDADTAALFPSRLVESELGLIPEGWEVKALGEVLVPRTERVGVKEVDEYQCSNNGVVPRAEKYKKALSVSNERNLIIQRGDLVFGLSRQVLNFGVMHAYIGCVSPAYKVLTVKDSMIDPFLLYRHMRARHDYYYGLVSASSREGQAVSMGSFQHIVTFIPTRSIQHAWIRFITQIESLQQQFDSQSRTLASLRDTLLPQLMSGEDFVRRY